MPGRQKTELYCLCWNDVRMLPFFFRHYDDIVDRYFIFDNGSTDGSLELLENHEKVEISHFEVDGDSFCEEERIMSDTIWSDSNADWVIITDIDEHIYHPYFTDYLQQCTDQGITAIQSIGYEMISDSFPDGILPLIETVTIGTRSNGHDRLCVFNPKAVMETNFSVGRHEANPAGHIVWPENPEVLLLHYKQLGIDYPIARSQELRRGLRSRDIENSWGVHYTWDVDKIIANWREIHDASGFVPGLGTLKDIEPAKYFEDNRIIQKSGLFDEKWYLLAYPDVEEAGVDAFVHYCDHGWRESRRPNFYFHPEWYCEQYPELCSDIRNPLRDYIVIGEKQDASPSPLFDTAWYRKEHNLGPNESPLQHYLAQRLNGEVSPIADFDVADYCRQYPEVLDEGRDPFEDYCQHNE